MRTIGFTLAIVSLKLGASLLLRQGIHSRTSRRIERRSFQPVHLGAPHRRGWRVHTPYASLLTFQSTAGTKEYSTFVPTDDNPIEPDNQAAMCEAEIGCTSYFSGMQHIEKDQLPQQAMPPADESPVPPMPPTMRMQIMLPTNEPSMQTMPPTMSYRCRSCLRRMSHRCGRCLRR